MEVSTEYPPVHDLPDDFFKFYKIYRGPVLGRGMSGEVVLATSMADPSFKKAVKIMSLLTPDGGIENIRLFTKEVMTMHRLSHPHIMQYETLARCPGYLVICTDYCANRTLTSNLTSLNGELLAKYFIQMACAVRYLNSDKRIIHNDIKLDNIFINAKNNAILGDFGLSVELSPGCTIIPSKNLGGTIGFSAPEKRTSAFVDPYKLDMYSLGAVLLCMVTFRDRPYEHAYKFLEDDHVADSSTLSDVPCVYITN